MIRYINEPEARPGYEAGAKLRIWECRAHPGTYFATHIEHNMPESEWRKAFTIQKKFPRFVLCSTGQPVDVLKIIDSPGAKRAAYVRFEDGTTQEVGVCDILEGATARFHYLKAQGLPFAWVSRHTLRHRHGGTFNQEKQH